MSRVLFFLALCVAAASAFVAPVQHAGTFQFSCVLVEIFDAAQDLGCRKVLLDVDTTHPKRAVCN